MIDFWYNVGDLFQWIFLNVLEPLGNMPNLLFFFIMLAGLFYWMFVVQKKYTKKAKDTGGLV